MLIFPALDPVALSLGPLKIRWYGLMYMFGFIAGWLLGRWRAKRTQGAGLSPGATWTPEQVDDLITYCVLGLILGARFGYTLFYDFTFFASNPMEIFKIWKGGMSFHGGLLGLVVTTWMFTRKTGKTFSDVADFLVPLCAPGLFFGRMGNFINGELWGRTTSAPWGMLFPDPAAGDLPRHPSQLYEAGLEGLLLFVIVWVYSSKPRPPLAVTGLFIGCYGLFRSFVEFFRQPDLHLGFIAFDFLSMGQLLSIPMILVGFGLMFWAYRREKA
jgi:phosphatidylglycerol:prolipoprotein diacylglycerol transferase